MKTRFASSIALPLAGALVLVLAGCGTMDRNSDRMAQTSGYAGSSSTPSHVDPFSPGYVPFPVNAVDTAAFMGHSVYCQSHFNEPGCQSAEPMRERGFSRK